MWNINFKKIVDIEFKLRKQACTKVKWNQVLKKVKFILLNRTRYKLDLQHIIKREHNAKENQRVQNERIKSVIAYFLYYYPATVSREENQSSKKDCWKNSSIIRHTIHAVPVPTTQPLLNRCTVIKIANVLYSLNFMIMNENDVADCDHNGKHTTSHQFMWP